jgi:signal peptidase I
MSARSFLFFATAGWSVLMAGCASHAQTTARPRVSNGSRREVWQDAELLAAREPGREVLFGAGESMAPVYGDGSVLVTRPIDYRQLRPGMTVVYINVEGRRVAHRLIRQEDHGWRAQGINNAAPDSDLVTPENLVGVVYASLAQDAGATPASEKEK